ncbi:MULTISPECIES: hypothetical protein [unclassified Campylobacter]|uniref:hypothetical protein n=1 Tax=unclassified Campylobacter TaxID=2593542 RepID=UPI00123834AB|nr:MULTISPECIES: hypothetical protein [unclassified Campylobacter]KAA6224763.1 hypothetical protein FMM57_08540 [Campylobacter sp. LR286c]KAA6224869.1 hypothetical protein FMM55_08510 [Campylobacter sp. LR196d]KAA6228858.1 hypothetical protein FMM54_00010 [Campylobacter sp. LR185c]KAA6233421.1 hypothetical protein FMM58_02280 [Campylobacter sp. LR291e]KAA6233602.1 hypothetical protein FMM56_03000 [Campylobacter sp. LR264d]
MKFSAIVPIYTDLKNKEKHYFALINNKPVFFYLFEILIENAFIDKVICYFSNENFCQREFDLLK